MRLAELELLKYGRFEGGQLKFSQGQIDLHIVFGANEAGKSTTMSAIADLLFGFPHITSYDFRFDKQLLRIGAVLQADGVNLACRRKKGRTGTLLDMDDRALDEGALTAMLAGYTAESFQRMFSLDHKRLRDGGRAILAAQDDIGQAIFAAGSGLVGVAEVLDSLESESKAIWTKRAGDRRYYAAEDAYEEAKTRQKAAQIRPAAWEELRLGLDRLGAALAELRLRRGALEREREVVERRRRVLPHAALYRRDQTELAPLVEVPDLPPDAGEVLNRVATALATANAETLAAAVEREQAHALLESLVADKRLIDRRDDIEALRETKGAVDKSLSDLPRRHGDLTSRSQRQRELQRELGWPEVAAPTVKNRLPQRVRLAEVRNLLETRSALDATLASAKAEEVTAHQTLRHLQGQLSEVPPLQDLGDLSAALRYARSLGDLDSGISTAERNANRRGAALATGLAQLAPWTGTVDALRVLILPSDEEVADALSEGTRAEAALTEARRAHQAEFDQKTALELQRTHLERDNIAVSSETIQEARENRNALWRDVRSHLIDERSLPDPGAAAVEFERRTSNADGSADRRYAAAEQSARLATLQENLEHNALALAQKANHVVKAQAAAETVTGSWRALLAPVGLQLEPKAFSAWTDRRRRALDAADEADLSQAALQEALRSREGARARLAGSLAALGKQAAMEQPFELMLQGAERLETEEYGIAMRRQTLTAEVAAANSALARAEAMQLTASRDVTEWEKKWESAVAAAGLNAGNSHTVVRAQLDLLEELRGDVDEILSLEQRIATMEADVMAFGERVAALARFCGMEADGRPPADLLLELTSAARDAADIQIRRTTLEMQIAQIESRTMAADAARVRALAQLRPLTDAAGTSDRGELAVVIQRSVRVRHLRQELDRLAEEILKAGAGSSLDALLTESENAEAMNLTIRSNELKEELRGLSDEINRLTSEHAMAQASFAELDDGPDAAVAAADAELARAEMAVQAEAYIRKRAEVALLRWTISRYRAEKQTPLLRRASNLFAKLTLGRYTELLVDFDGDNARLGGLDKDKQIVPVEGMSDGTIDQLFLALRLAGVEDAVSTGAKLPFLADDLFINYDDERARAGFQVLAELAQTTQVLFFTHHQHLVTVAEAALAPSKVPKCVLI